MIALTLQQLFGQSATQTDSYLTIYKADLPGLSASANNGGEQLLVALLLQVHQQFEGMLTDEQGGAIADEQGRAITYDNRELYERLELWFWKRQFTKKDEFFYILNTFIADIFIFPPTEPGQELNPDLLNY